MFFNDSLCTLLFTPIEFIQRRKANRQDS